MTSVFMCALIWDAVQTSLLERTSICTEHHPTKSSICELSNYLCIEFSFPLTFSLSTTLCTPYGLQRTVRNKLSRSLGTRFAPKPI